MGFFRRHSPLPTGWQIKLPEGRLATPEEAAEYRRRKRRLAIYNCLIFLGLLPVAFWIAVAFIQSDVVLIGYVVAVALLLAVLQGFAENTFRCPACGVQLATSSMTPRWQLSPARRAALYGRYVWCDGCGTRFEKYPNAVYPPESDHDQPPDPDER